MDNDIVLFESGDGQVTLPVRVDATEREIWLNHAQLAVLFDRDVKTIGKHINIALREELAGQREWLSQNLRQPGNMAPWRIEPRLA